MERYHVSRATVRQALGQLVAEGYLVIRRGLGTYVAEPKIRAGTPRRMYSFSREIERLGMRPGTHVQALGIEPAGPSVAAALDVPIGEPVVALRRLRTADDEPMMLETSWLPVRRFPGLVDKDLERRASVRRADRRLRRAAGTGPRGIRARPAEHRRRPPARQARRPTRPCSWNASRSTPRGARSSSAGASSGATAAATSSSCGGAVMTRPALRRPGAAVGDLGRGVDERRRRWPAALEAARERRPEVSRPLLDGRPGRLRRRRLVLLPRAGGRLGAPRGPSPPGHRRPALRGHPAADRRHRRRTARCAAARHHQPVRHHLRGRRPPRSEARPPATRSSPSPAGPARRSRPRRRCAWSRRSATRPPIVMTRSFTSMLALLLRVIAGVATSSVDGRRLAGRSRCAAGPLVRGRAPSRPPLRRSPGRPLVAGRRPRRRRGVRHRVGGRPEADRDRPRPVDVYQPLEFRHGPISVIEPGVLVVALLG